MSDRRIFVRSALTSFDGTGEFVKRDEGDLAALEGPFERETRGERGPAHELLSRDERAEFRNLRGLAADEVVCQRVGVRRRGDTSNEQLLLTLALAAGKDRR